MVKKKRNILGIGNLIFAFCILFTTNVIMFTLSGTMNTNQVIILSALPTFMIVLVMSRFIMME